MLNKVKILLPARHHANHLLRNRQSCQCPAVNSANAGRGCNHHLARDADCAQRITQARTSTSPQIGQADRRQAWTVRPSSFPPVLGASTKGQGRTDHLVRFRQRSSGGCTRPRLGASASSPSSAAYEPHRSAGLLPRQPKSGCIAACRQRASPENETRPGGLAARFRNT